MGLPGSIYPLSFDVLARCLKIMVFQSQLDSQKKHGPKHAREHHCRQRGGTYACRGPWGGHVRDQKEKKGEKERSQLESLREGGNIGIF